MEFVNKTKNKGIKKLIFEKEMKLKINKCDANDIFKIKEK